MWSYQMSYYDLCTAIESALKNQKKTPYLSDHQILCYRKSLENDPILEGLIGRYPPFQNEWKNLLKKSVERAVLRSPHNDDVHSAASPGVRNQAFEWLLQNYCRDSQSREPIHPTYEMLEQDLEFLRHYVGLRSPQGVSSQYDEQLIREENSRYLDRQERGDYFAKQRSRDSLETIKADFDEYLDDLKNLFRNGTFAQKEFYAMMQWFRAQPDSIGALETVIGLLDYARTSYHLSDRKLITDRNKDYTCPKGFLERIGDTFFSLMPQEEQSFKYSEMLDSWLSPFISHDSETSALRPSQKMYDDYLEVAGYQVVTMQMRSLKLSVTKDSKAYQNCYEAYVRQQYETLIQQNYHSLSSLEKRKYQAQYGFFVTIHQDRVEVDTEKMYQHFAYLFDQKIQRTMLQSEEEFDPQGLSFSFSPHELAIPGFSQLFEENLYEKRQLQHPVNPLADEEIIHRLEDRWQMSREQVLCLASIIGQTVHHVVQGAFYSLETMKMIAQEDIVDLNYHVGYAFDAQESLRKSLAYYEDYDATQTYLRWRYVRYSPEIQQKFSEDIFSDLSQIQHKVKHYPAEILVTGLREFQNHQHFALYERACREMGLSHGSLTILKELKHIAQSQNKEFSIRVAEMVQCPHAHCLRWILEEAVHEPLNENIRSDLLIQNMYHASSRDSFEYLLSTFPESQLAELELCQILGHGHAPLPGNEMLEVLFTYLITHEHLPEVSSQREQLIKKFIEQSIHSSHLYFLELILEKKPDHVMKRHIILALRGHNYNMLKMLLIAKGFIEKDLEQQIVCSRAGEQMMNEMKEQCARFMTMLENPAILDLSWLTARDRKVVFFESMGNPLNIAITHHPIEVIRQLLDHGINWSHPDVKNHTPIVHALIEKKVDIALLLLERQSVSLENIDHMDQVDQETLISFYQAVAERNLLSYEALYQFVKTACLYQRHDVAVCILKIHPQMIDDLPISGRSGTLLNLMIDRPGSDRVQELIQKNPKCHHSIAYAITENHSAMLQKLLRYGVDIKEFFDDPENIRICVRKDHESFQFIQRLLSAGAQIFNRKKLIDEVIGIAGQGGVSRLLERLEEFDHDRHQFFSAIAGNDLNAVRQSLVDIEKIDCEYDVQSPLVWAILHQSWNIVELLIDQKFDINRLGQTLQGESCTALEAAASVGELSVLEVLLSMNPEISRDLQNSLYRIGLRSQKEGYFELLEKYQLFHPRLWVDQNFILQAAEAGSERVVCAFLKQVQDLKDPLYLEELLLATVKGGLHDIAQSLFHQMVSIKPNQLFHRCFEAAIHHQHPECAVIFMQHHPELYSIQKLLDIKLTKYRTKSYGISQKHGSMHHLKEHQEYAKLIEAQEVLKILKYFFEVDRPIPLSFETVKNLLQYFAEISPEESLLRKFFDFYLKESSAQKTFDSIRKLGLYSDTAIQSMVSDCYAKEKAEILEAIKQKDLLALTKSEFILKSVISSYDSEEWLKVLIESDDFAIYSIVLESRPELVHGYHFNYYPKDHQLVRVLVACQDVMMIDDLLQRGLWAQIETNLQPGDYFKMIAENSSMFFLKRLFLQKKFDFEKAYDLMTCSLLQYNTELTAFLWNEYPEFQSMNLEKKRELMKNICYCGAKELYESFIAEIQPDPENRSLAVELLILVCEGGQSVEIFEDLLQRCGDSTAPTIEPNLLIHAYMGGHPQMIQRLENLGYRLSRENFCEVFFETVWRDLPDIQKQLLSQAPQMGIDPKDMVNEIPPGQRKKQQRILAQCVIKSSVQSLQVLLNAGADPNLPSHTHVLIAAIAVDSLEKMQCLLEYGASLELEEKINFLEFAKERSPKLHDFFVKYEEMRTIIDSSDRDTLIASCLALLEHPQKKFHESGEIWMAHQMIKMAIQSLPEDVVVELLDRLDRSYGRNIVGFLNQRNYHDETLLEIACSAHHQKIAQKLVEMGSEFTKNSQMDIVQFVEPLNQPVLSLLSPVRRNENQSHSQPKKS